MLDAELIQKALDALVAGDADGAAEVLKQLIAQAASGGEKPPEEKPAESPPEAASAEDQAMVKAFRTVLTLLNAKDAEEGMTLLSTMVERVKELDKREADLVAAKAALEDAERRKLVAELVKCGAELPATAWKKDADGVPTTVLCDRLAKEPMDSLRERVAAFASARPAKKEPAKAPASGDKQFTTPHGVVSLSARELEMCEQMKVSAEKYAANKAIREAAIARKGV